MDRIEYLSQRLNLAKQFQKRWEKREKEWKAELQDLLDEEVQVKESDFFYMNAAIWTTEEEVKEYFENRFGSMYEIINLEKVNLAGAVEHEEVDDPAWLVSYGKKTRYHRVVVETDDYEVERNSYVVNSDIDVDVLRKTIDPEEFSRITTVESQVVLDPEAVKRWIDADPEALYALSIATKAGSPRVTLKVKRKKDE